MGERNFRWGLLSTANITERDVIPGIRLSKTGTVDAVASRSLDKSQPFADKWGIPKAYGTYEELLADPDIDAIYIPLPNHLHREWTIRAAKAGKHVLCEKPLAMNTAEAEEMVAECRKAGVHFAEAFMYRHHPRYDRIREVLKSGEIGEMRLIRGAFTYNNAEDKDNIRYVKNMGGGSLYDVGCYPISAARMLIGSEPVAASVQAVFAPEYDQVDMSASGLLEFPGGITLTFDCGMWSFFRNTLEVLGSHGRIEIPHAFLPKSEESASFRVYTAAGLREENVPPVNAYAQQADDFAEAVWGGKKPRFEAEDAILNMRVIEACLASAERRERIEIKR